MKNTNKTNNQKHIPIIALILPILAIIGIIVFAIWRFKSFINPIELDHEITAADYEAYVDCLDMIVPLRDEDGNAIKQDVKKILVLGSDSFAADRTSDQGMAALLAKQTGAEVVNLAITGSTLTMDCDEDGKLGYYPSDLFTAYRLVKMMLEPGIYDSILSI